MPLWKDEELDAARTSCFPDVSRDNMLELFDYVGGTIRFTLVKAKKGLPELLSNIISVFKSKIVSNRMNAQKIIKLLSSSYNILHIETDEVVLYYILTLMIIVLII